MSAEKINQQIEEIEHEISKTQKHKGTESHLGLLKAKIAKLKRQLLEPSGGGGGKGGDGFDVSKVGDARVGLVGFPSVGKSTLLSTITGTYSEAAAYEFTTLTCIPGIIRYNGARIQMLDLPGIIEGAADGKGRGRQVISTARTCNLILVVLDCSKPVTHKKLIEKELEGFGIRINKQPPKITVRKKDKGGITLTTQAKNASVSLEAARAICQEYRIINADILIQSDCSLDDLVDAIEGSRIYMPVLYVMNKIDAITLEELDVINQMPNYVPIAAAQKWNLDGLVDTIWERLDLVRVYTKPKGLDPDFNDPVVLPRQRSSVEDFCNRLHKAIMKDFKYALVYGMSAKHRPQRVGKDHVLEDEDIVQIVKKI